MPPPASPRRPWSASRLASYAPFLTMLLAACKAGPDYAAPALEERTGAGWRAPRDADLGGERMDLAAWWERLGDPELDVLARELVRANLSLAQARQRLVAARARRGIARADRLPSVDVDGSYTRAGTGAESLNFAGPPPGERVDVFSAGLAAAWELDLWGRVARLEEAADAEVGAAIDDYRDAAVSLLAELALAYVDARTLAERIDVVQRNVALQERTLALAEDRLAAGNGPRLDVEQTRRLLEETRARIPELQRARAVAENRVAVLVGERPADGLVAGGAPLELPVGLGLGLPADLLSRRADVRAAERRLAAAVANVGAAEAEGYPRVAITGTIAARSDSFGGVFDGGDALSYTVGPGLVFPLFEGGRIAGGVALREAAAEEARLALERTLLEAIEEVENAAAGVARTRQRLDGLEQAATAARASVALAQELYDAGLRDLLQLLDAQRALVALEDDLLVARQSALAETVRLYRALGGGWESIALDGSAAGASEGREDG